MGKRARVAVSLAVYLASKEIKRKIPNLNLNKPHHLIPDPRNPKYNLDIFRFAPARCSYLGSNLAHTRCLLASRPFNVVLRASLPPQPCSMIRPCRLHPSRRHKQSPFVALPRLRSLLKAGLRINGLVWAHHEHRRAHSGSKLVLPRSDRDPANPGCRTMEYPKPPPSFLKIRHLKAPSWEN